MKTTNRRFLIFSLATISSLGIRAFGEPSPTPQGAVMVEAVGEKETKWKPRPTRPLDSWPGASQLATDSGLNKFGGRFSGKHQATGFFRVEKIGGRWWLIDPEGGEFFHCAVAGVRPLAGSRAQGVLQKKFGSDKAWGDSTAALLKKYGFVGTGAWSADALLAPAPVRPVYTKIWNFIAKFGVKHAGARMGTGHTNFPNKCVPVFDPEFEKFCEEEAKQLAAFRDDPWLLGHFSDNELTFVRGTLKNYLELPEDNSGYIASWAWLRERYGAEAKAGQVNAKDEADFLTLVVDRYYRIVSAAIRRNDPNHLFLGSRFYGPDRRTAEIFRASGPYLDIVSMNWYNTWTPLPETIEMWAKESGRPVIITEFYAKGQDSGLANTSGAGFLVRTQKDRGLFYENFTIALLQSKNCVGWHWFRYADNEPGTGLEDASNRDANKGIVNADYEPYNELLDRMKPVNERVYSLIDYFDKGGGAN